MLPVSHDTKSSYSLQMLMPAHSLACCRSCQLGSLLSTGGEVDDKVLEAKREGVEEGGGGVRVEEDGKSRVEQVGSEAGIPAAVLREKGSGDYTPPHFLYTFGILDGPCSS